jgi:hypothetical protein
MVSSDGIATVAAGATTLAVQELKMNSETLILAFLGIFRRLLFATFSF